MGWHVGMSYEEMQKEYGGVNGGTKPAGSAEDGSDSNSNSNSNSQSSKCSKTCISKTAALELKVSPTPTACPLPTDPDGSISSKPPAPPKDHEHVYHLCRKNDWEDALESQTPYFPPTFLKDGRCTKASLYIEDIVDVANEFYRKSSPPSEEWIVLEIRVQFLYHGLGIPVLAAIALESHRSGNAYPVQCLQIFGGVSTHPMVLGSLITSVYPLERRAADGIFFGITCIGSAGDSFRYSSSTKKRNAPQKIKSKRTSAEKANETNKKTTKKKKEKGSKEKGSEKKKKGFFSKLL